MRTFKAILKACHNEIRNNEGLDPTAAFDEMAKVMFCKLYEEKENPRRNRFRLSVFDSSLRDLGVNVVKRILQDAKQADGYRDIFAPDTAITLKDRTIRKIVAKFENYDLGLTAFDVKGEAFEFFLGDTFTGGLGEFFTPRNAVEFIVDAVSPRIGESIVDPFCGTGGFLIYAFEVISEKIRLQDFADDEKARWREDLSNRCLFGTDWKERTAQACKMNMMVHGDGSSGVFRHDGLTNVPGQIEDSMFDLCITNPPFGALETDPVVLDRYKLGRGRASQDRAVLALERAITLVKPGGRVAIVVIDGILNNTSTAYVRDYIRENALVLGVVSLSTETFQGYGARAKTSVLFLERRHRASDQQMVFLAIARNTGIAPNGNPQPGNELPDILMDYRDFCEQSEIVHSQSGAWTAELSGRLDAEFYQGYEPVPKRDVSAIREEMVGGLRRARQLYTGVAELQQFFEELDTTKARIRDILVEVKDRELVENDRQYRLLGVRWWGEGAFVREDKAGSQIKGKYLKPCRAGQLIYNRLFCLQGFIRRA